MHRAGKLMLRLSHLLIQKDRLVLVMLKQFSRGFQNRLQKQKDLQLLTEQVQKL